MAIAFQANAFQQDAFQISLIASTANLSMPIDYFLADNPLNIISDEKTVLGKLFTTRTSGKGYD